MENYIVAIDISASRVALLAARCNAEKPYGIEEVCRAEAKSEGIVRRGIVTNKAEAQKAIKSLFTNKALPKAVEGKSAVYYCMSINGYIYSTTSSQARVSPVPGGTVNYEVLKQLACDAQDNCPMTAKQEIVSLSLRSAVADGISNITTIAEGTKCDSIEATYTMTLANREILNQMRQLLANQRIENFYTTTSSRCVSLLTTEQKENGVAFIDMGATTTNIAVFFKGALQYEQSIPLGSDLITADMARGLEIKPYHAEKLKYAYGIRPDEAEDDNNITPEFEDGEEENRTMMVNDIKYYAAARAEELVSYIDSCIKKYESKDWIRSFVIAGGGARLKGIRELLADTLRKPVVVIEKTLAEEKYDCVMGMASRFARDNEKRFSVKSVPQQPDIFGGQEGEAANKPQQPEPQHKTETTEKTDKQNKSGFKNTIVGFWGKLKEGLSDGEDEF